MRTKFNFRLFVILVVGTVVFGIGWFFLHRYQTRRMHPEFLAQAKIAEEKKEPERAQRFYKRYLLMMPDDVEARALYANLVETHAVTGLQRAGAVAVYERVVTDKPDWHEMRRKLVKLAIGNGQLELAWEHVNLLPIEADKFYLLGQYWNRKRETGWGEKAEAAFRKALQLDPDNEDAAIKLAGVLLQLRGKEVDGLGVMDKLVEMQSNGKKETFRAYLARAQYRLAPQFRKALAEKADELKRCDTDSVEDMEQARKLAPEGHTDVLLGSTALELFFAADAKETSKRKPHVDRATKYLASGVKKHPSDARFYSGLAVLKADTGNWKEAIELLGEGQTRVPAAAKRDLMWQLTELYIDRGMTVEAKSQLKQMDGLKLPKPEHDFLSSRILIAERKWSEAAQMLEETRQYLGDTRLLSRCDLLLGTCYEQLDDTDRRLATYKRAAAKDLLNPAIQFRLALTLLQLQRPDEARQELKTIMNLEGAPPAGHAILARLLFQKTMDSQPEFRDWREVDVYLRAALDSEKKASLEQTKVVETRLLAAEVLIARGFAEEAATLLREMCWAHPKAVEPWWALGVMRTRVAKDRWREALSIMDEAEPHVGDCIDLRLARLRLLRGDLKESRPELDRAGANVDRFTDKEKSFLYQELAAILERLGEKDAAKRRLAEAAALDPDDLRSALAQYDHAMRANDRAGIEAALARMEKIDAGARVMNLYGRAGLLIWRIRRGETKLIPEAQALLKSVEARRSNWPRLLVAQGMLAALDKKEALALKYFQRAVDLGERDPVVIRSVLEGSPAAEADAVLGRLLKSAQLPVELRKVGAELAVRNSNPAVAVQLAQEEVKDRPASMESQIWFGTVLLLSKENEQAEAAFTKALELAPTNKKPYLALTKFYAITEQKDKAKAVLEQAMKELKDDESKWLTLAQCHEALGNLPAAEKSLLAALKLAPANADVLEEAMSFYQRQNQIAKAEPYLDKLLDPGIKSSVEQVKAARRGKAVLLWGKGNPEQFSQALNLVQANLASDPKNADDLAFKAVLLASKVERRKEAIAVFELSFANLSNRKPLPELHFTLAELLEKDGQWARARKEIETLLDNSSASKSTNYFDFMAAFADKLLDHDELQDAKLYIDTLVHKRPNHAASIELQARYLAGQGGTSAGERILALAMGFAENKSGAKTVPAEDHGRLLVTASLLEKLAHYDPGYQKPFLQVAEKMYRDYVAARSSEPKTAHQGVLVLAVFLARVNRLSEAFDLCDKTASKLPLDEALAAYMRILTLGDPDGPQLRKVESWLQENMGKKADSAEFQSTLAVVREWEKRFDEAERLYMRVLAKDTGNVGANNNLACLLALQNRGSGALKYIAKAIETAGPAAELLDSRAMVHLAMGNYGSAKTDLTEALAQHKTPVALFHMAQALKGLGQNEQAITVFDSALRHGLRPQILHPLERDSLARFVQFTEARKQKKT